MPDLHNIRLPAGWYPDPDGADHRRWWDGKTWTQHTAPFQRPAPVYDVVDLIESSEPGNEVTTPAPRGIRTAARLGRGLAALTHRLPFGLPRTGATDNEDGDADAPQAPPPAPPAPPRRGRHRN